LTTDLYTKQSVVHKMAESLLKECKKNEMRVFLNENGLLESKENFCIILLFLYKSSR
jgi:hypothetical protein